MSYYNQQQLSIGVLPPHGYPPEKYPKDAYPPQGYPLAGYPDTLHRTLRRPPAVNQPAFRHGRMTKKRIQK
ncbi:hypothetical protein C4D60_Mb04t13800 [Musa balbisiana]|uniref:Rhodopsin n=1 Tax=Musa balbisiana TaxID=52838 RepID=A0A4S8KBU3_MUSBA|nr:hypothetical protein C4D60_Mb04t13800 [Musa balbisiana]